MNSKVLIIFTALFACTALFAATPATPLGPTTRYASDAYPGFDDEDSAKRLEKKTPSWLPFVGKPSAETAIGQLAFAKDLLARGNYSAAASAFDVLVKYWPASLEAPEAQLALAQILFEKEKDWEEAYKAYRYMIDFYSAQCDYGAMIKRMLEAADKMYEHGKRIFFIHVTDRVTVRRAYETIVRCSPGAEFAPAVMMKIAELRTGDGDYAEAIQVYENIRNLYPLTEQATVSRYKEAEVRMKLLRDHEYNRQRCRDTIDYLKMALVLDTTNAYRKDYEAWLAEAQGVLEREAYHAAQFYDSRTRTRRSAIRAYERFLAQYPIGTYADQARARIEVLKGAVEAELAAAEPAAVNTPQAEDSNESAPKKESSGNWFANWISKYKWTSSVPEEYKTICVPTFINETKVAELGSVVTRQVLREVQRDGTFKIKTAGDSPDLEVQGVIKRIDLHGFSYNRLDYQRHQEYQAAMHVEISVIDKRTGKVLINNRPYEATTSFLSDGDIINRQRDASGRLAEDLAVQVVDDLILHSW